MELKQFSEELLVKMKGQIERLTLDQPDVILRTSQIISTIEAVILELKKVVLKYQFRNDDEEIEFFKTIKPVFISQLWFHRGLFKISLFESFNDGDSRTIYYRKQLRGLQRFIIKHEEFYHYALSNSVHMDEKFFLRVNDIKKSFIQDDRFSTAYDIKLSKILTNELLKDYIFNALQKIKSTESENLSGINSLKWTGSKTDLVELIYALHASEVFNKSASDVKHIASYFESIFNVSLGNYYRTFQEIRLRKSGQTNFLDEMRKKLLVRIQEAEF
jgi:hypothetical protein